MAEIIGTYECKVDVKGRLMFPSQLRAQIPSASVEGFVIKRSIFMKCLELYPKEEWQIESKRINTLNRFKKKNVDFIRKFMAGVKTAELDKTGRILIPKDLIKYGAIKSEIVLASVVNKIEIWDRAEYEKAVDYDPDEFASLAEEVMGDNETE
ncbi:MAG: division/cell wall cluster transcriptional repressor MraZ [Bacteroidetes bacterium HGW-Bacteroidetes-17]|nr:MAG: division/cell wall cluster transcriptional repressor MraZ [Bacteroidetes bacterium HGW-Bacteroidetes-17]